MQPPHERPWQLHIRWVYFLYLFICFYPLASLKQASHGHKLFSGWCRRTFCLRKSGFTPLPRMPDEFFGRAKATGCWGWCLVISCFPVNGSPNMKQHSGKLIGSDDICLSNNWFKSTCCGCRTPKLSRPPTRLCVRGKLLPGDFKPLPPPTLLPCQQKWLWTLKMSQQK